MKFRKNPVVIEAVQFDGNNYMTVATFLGNGKPVNPFHTCISDSAVFIQTLEGEMRADKDDWIIKGVKGEFYPCKPEIFAATYEPAE